MDEERRSNEVLYRIFPGELRQMHEFNARYYHRMAQTLDSLLAEWAEVKDATDATAHARRAEFFERLTGKQMLEIISDPTPDIRKIFEEQRGNYASLAAQEEFLANHVADRDVYLTAHQIKGSGLLPSEIDDAAMQELLFERIRRSAFGFPKGELAEAVSPAFRPPGGVLRRGV